MVHHVLYPREVCIALGRNAIVPTQVVLQPIAAPILQIKRWVSQNEVEPLILMQIVEERICVARAQIGINTTNGQIHRSHLPSGGIALLPENRQVIDVACMPANELGRLHEHATRTAARVIHATMIRLDDFHQRAHDAGRRIEFTGILTFRLGELSQAILVGTPQDIARVALLSHLNVGEQVNHFAKTSFVQFLTSKILRQNTLQLIVLGLDFAHSLIDYLANFGRMRSSSHCFPTSLFRNIENALVRVFVAILFEAFTFINKFLILLLKLIRNIFQEDEAKHHVLVLRCVNVSAQFISSLPNLLFKANFRGIVRFLLCHADSLLVYFRVGPQLALRHDRLRCIGHAFRRVFILAQKALYGTPHTCSSAFFLLPVYRSVLSHCFS